MDTVRTTITLPSDLHEELRLLSIRERKSLGELVVEKLQGKNKYARMDIEKRIQRDFKIFQETARSCKVDISAEQAVREERDRDNA